MKTNTAASPAPALSQRAALARLASVTAPRPSPASFAYVAARWLPSPDCAAPLRELPARFSFDAKSESAAREVVAAVVALGYEVKCAVFIGENRSFVPLILSAPETEDAAAKHPENTVRRVMGHAAPLYTEQSAAA